MRVFGALLLVLGIGAVPVLGQEPRLPGPSVTPTESEALIQRARALSAAGTSRESAAVWQTVGAREPVIASLATRESVRALIAAGDIEPALRGLSDLGTAAPSELLLRAADACRAAGTFDCATSLYRRARQAAGRSVEADEAAIGLAATHEQEGNTREALEDWYRELQLTLREATAFEIADAGARRLSSKVTTAGPLTEADYDVIVDRLAGIAAFRRAADMQAEWLKNFSASSRREEIESQRVQYLYSLRANDEARLRANTFLKEHPDSAETGGVFVTLFRLDVREGRSADVEKRGRTIMGGEIAGTTLSDRQGAARLLAEYLVSIGQPTKALGVYSALYKMTPTRSGRVDVLWRMAIASISRQPPRASRQRAGAGAAPEARFRNRACRDVLAGARAERRGLDLGGTNAVGVARAALSLHVLRCACSGRAAAPRRRSRR